MQTKSKDAVSKGMHVVKGSNDEQLSQRARSVIGEVTDKGSDIDVEVHNGRLTISGPVERAQVSRLRDALSRVPGLSSIEDRLEVRESQTH